MLQSLSFVFVCSFFFFIIIIHFAVNRAKEAAKQYRAEAGAKVQVAAKVSLAVAAQHKLRATLKTHEAKAESVQQYRHERNRAVMKLETTYAEIRALKKHNTELQKEAETCKKR